MDPDVWEGGGPQEAEATGKVTSDTVTAPGLQKAFGKHNHLLGQFLYCQPGSPSPVLLKMFDDEQMFQYNFTDRSIVPRIASFKNWASQDTFSSPTDLEFYLQLCNSSMENFTQAAMNITPETKGILDIKVFTVHPLTMGEPNTLICFIGNVIPPALIITWRKNGVLLKEGVGNTGYFAMKNLQYQIFSYLNITPTYTDSYTCNVQEAGDSTISVAYWVPEYPIPSEVLLDALCGLALAFGIMFLFTGFLFLYLTRRLHNAD
ncbi:hypothetical protein GDO86_015592 [Hymenochirus boettgeri]|uniref:Ig-like domain-containing protein n=1 Tax=Hymenochirus boettgeri TaxID=247094 RepID=A0A8T2JZE6_9PIPI|nr:hypothetical protein GDO86_015592 [Hymenochirus boettgeri]